MRVYYDFHIHTALSPCGDGDMTPNNIVNMCLLKGLDAIAITDHNSAENCLACMKVGKEKGLLVIPGIELQTREEVHLLCLFKDINAVLAFQKLVYMNMTEQKNRPEYFGSQLIFDEMDNIIEESSRLLMSSVNMTINDAIRKAVELEGLVIPAHVDKKAYSILSNLGFIPDTLSIKTLEISKQCDIIDLLKKFPDLKGYSFMQNSDAHYLWQLLEKESYLDIREKTTEAIFEALITH
ncbi:MAG: PHP domain-containing protein [Thermotaleaceae bacterium]